MPRHLRCPLTGTLWTKCATQKPISALNTTALTAKTTDCRNTNQKVSRENRDAKLSRPTKCSIPVFRIERWIEYRAGYSTSSAMMRISGSGIANAMVDFRSRNFLTRSNAHEALELRGRPADRLFDRLAALRALRDELGRDGLGIDLRRDLRRRGESRDLQDLPGLGWIVVQRALGRAFVGPRPEIVQLGEGRDVVPLARRDHLLDRRTPGDVHQQV